MIRNRGEDLRKKTCDKKKSKDRRYRIVQNQLSQTAPKMSQQCIWWEIEIVEIGMVDEIMTPVTSVLTGDEFVFLSLGL